MLQNTMPIHRSHTSTVRKEAIVRRSADRTCQNIGERMPGTAIRRVAVESDGMAVSVVLGVLTAAEVAGMVALFVYVRRRHSR
jgi:hypothetical protein